MGLSLELESSTVNTDCSHPDNNEAEFTGHLRIQNQESEERKQLLHAKILRQFHGLETNIQKHLKLIM
jgi:hypothetical protein